MIPLISSLCRGPLGVCQLPRFWWKAIAHAAGLLDEEYPDFSTGLDLWVTQVLELDRESTLRYLREKTPSYPEFKAWVVQTRGRVE